MSDVFDLDVKLKHLSEIANENELERLAVESGMAIVVVDESGFHVATANNNSICRTLNPDGKLTGMCRDFCGTALEETRAVGASVTYTCHAGLACAAVRSKSAEQPLVTIV
jgi:ligand-binding sensor protein